ADTETFSQAGQDAYDELHRCLFAVKDGAVMFGEIALARGAVQLPPGAAIGMAIGPQIVQPQPATIVTLGVGTKVPGGVHGPGAPVRWRHGIGPWRGHWRRLAGLSFTQGTGRLMRQTRECFGLGGTLALGFSCRG